MFSHEVLFEGFEEGIMPPTGWKHIIHDAQYTWKIVTFPVHSGTKAAQCPRTSGFQDEWLISSNIDVTQYQTASLDFWCNTTLYATADMHCEVVVQGHGVNAIIWNLSDENLDEWSTYAWREKSLALTPFCGNIINISWHYYGGGGKKNFGLDDISVSAQQFPKIQIGNITGGIMNITAEIKNINEDIGEDAFNVTWNITATGHGLLRELNFSANGMISEIDHNGGVALVTLSKATDHNHKPLVGFGLLSIIVKAAIPNNPRVEPVMKTIDGFIIGPFVLIR